MNRSGIMATLREETLPEHQGLESSLDLMDQTLSLADYIETLQSFETFASHWETKAASTCPEHLRPFFEKRRRSQWIRKDLLYFGAKFLEGSPDLPEIGSNAELLGSMYVMEGSTLGGQLISRHLERVLGLKDGAGYCYFRGHGADTGRMWQEFCRILTNEAEELDHREIVDAARMTFRSFHACLLSRKR